ncbi:MAG: helix-turn-helix transcriptional regulator [Clostridia bacterium]|nr:helix-turn-helix transcriptional regulator [Clostridia bacterium]
MITNNSVLVANVKNKIKELLDIRKMSIYDLASRSELTEACIRNWFTVRNYTPSLEAIEKVSKALGVQPFELLCDDTNVIAATPENQSFLTQFRNLTITQKKAILTVIDSYISDED